jgi:transcriptional regulator with XRE-family HTH domain
MRILPQDRLHTQRLDPSRLLVGSGFRLEELARRLGLNPSTVRAWEGDEIRKRHRRLARVFEEYVRGM